MTQYRLKNPAVDAVQFNGETLDKLPDFVRNYQAHSSLGGNTNVGRDITSNLLIPHSGGFHTVRPGDWLIFDGSRLWSMRPHHFDALYEQVPVDLDTAPVTTITAPEGAASVDLDTGKPVTEADVLATLPQADAPVPVVAEETTAPAAEA